MEFVGPLVFGICLAVAAYMISPFEIRRGDGSSLSTQDYVFVLGVFALGSISCALFIVVWIRFVVPMLEVR